MPKLTADRLREVLHYEPVSGVFIWRAPINNRIKVGNKAGSASNGYINISIDGENHGAHRLAWLYMTGEWPQGEVDHINGVPSDNRWSNLRDVGRTKNAQNIRKPKSNGQSGFLGVSHRKDTGRYQAFITIERKRKTLGCYATAEAAHAAYLEAKRQLHEGNTL